MNRLLLVLLALGVVVLALLWFGVAGRESRQASVRTAGEPAAEEVEASAPAPAPPAAVEPRSGESEQPAEPSPTSSARHEVATSYEAELARAQWVEGRVVFPEGTPADERVFVIARGKDFEHGEDHRAEVGRDGRFRVAFSEEAKTGWLVLEAHHLYLEDNFRWKRVESAGPIVLEPELGGRIAGRLLLPEGVDAVDAAFMGGKVQLQEERRQGNHSSIRHKASVEVAVGLDFEFGGLPTEWSYRVSYEGEMLVSPCAEIRVEPGETRALELGLEKGAELSGRILDEAGTALADALVRANVETETWPSSAYRRVQSGEDGSFTLRGLAAGEARIQAELDGYETAERSLGRLHAAETRHGIELVLSRGNAIAGRVVWPDGSPAEATVTVQESSRGFGFDEAAASEETAADGSFRITGLGDGAVRVQARATKTEEVLVKSELTGRERKKKQRTALKALAEHVEPGTDDLLLTLSSGLELSGRVVDDLGASVSDFRLTANRMVLQPQGWWRPEEPLGRVYRETDGTFVLDGLVQGEWQLSVSGDGYGDSEPVRVTVPVEGALVLVLPREARIRGVVLDASGAAVEGAYVRAEQEHPGLEMVAFGMGDDGARTDARGAFELDGLSPGPAKLVAELADRARSEPLALELEAGRETSDVVLRLRTGGTITGQVLGLDGRGEANRSVNVFHHSNEYHEACLTDADGRFEVRGVPPGDTYLSTETSDGLELQQRATVVEGETVHVRFAPGGVTPVRLHGRVLAGGEPCADARVHAQRRSDSRDFSSSSSQTDGEGAYELTLPGGGSYWFNLWSNEGRFSWRTQVTVPEGPSFAFDFAIPLGRVSGRVTLDGGRGVAGIPVEARGPSTVERPSGSARAVTDDGGRYELDVPAGTYAIRAGGNSWQARESRRSFAEVRVDDVAVAENAHVRGIDFVLTAAGAIEGVVRLPDGSLARPAHILSRGAGPQDTDLGWAMDGRFHIVGLTPGTHLIGATCGTHASREWIRVEIEPGTVQRVELELVPATVLQIRVVDRSGAEIEAEVEVSDPEGRVQRAHADEKGAFWTEPLPAGSYTVRARRGEKSVERTVTLSADEERSVLELVLE